MVCQVNETVSKKSGENGFHFILNDNIFWKHFCEDGVHFCRHFILNEFWDNVACNDSHFEDQNRDIDKCSPENSSENIDSNLKINKIQILKIGKIQIFSQK